MATNVAENAQNTDPNLDKDSVAGADTADTANDPEINDEVVKEAGNNQTTHDKHGPAEHIHHTKPCWLHTLVAKYPLPCCCFFLFWFILCGIIIMANPGLLAFSTDVPFYIRGNEATTLADAVIAGENDATWQRDSEANTASITQESSAGVELRLIFRALDGNTLMTERYLGIYCVHLCNECV